MTQPRCTASKGGRTNIASALQDTIEVYNLGYPLGRKLEEADAKTDQYVLNNHLRFKILYHPIENDEGTGDAADGSPNCRTHAKLTLPCPLTCGL